MTYRVVLHRLAKVDLYGYYRFAAQHSIVDASRWLDRFETALHTLSERPERCSLSREGHKLKLELRDFLFGKRPHVYRVVFIINESTVRVLRICRSRRNTLSAEQINEALTNE